MPGNPSSETSTCLNVTLVDDFETREKSRLSQPLPPWRDMFSFNKAESVNFEILSKIRPTVKERDFVHVAIIRSWIPLDRDCEEAFRVI